MKKINIPLTSKGIKEFKSKIDNLIKEMPKVNEEILSELATLGQSEIEKNRAAIPYTDGNDDYKVFKEKTKNGYSVGARGSQVLYDEFGTGTEGLNKPHDLKDKFNLNPYNNRKGTTIRENTNPNSTATEKGIPINGLYWTYKDKGGNIVYTQGIPAGKEVFNAEKAVERKKKQIVSKKVGEILSKL